MTQRKTNLISAFVMVKNGERTIERCVRSLHWADELVVLDTGSTDRTVVLAKKAGAEVRKAVWEGFSKTRNKGIKKLKGPWVLVLDADEWVSLVSSSEYRVASKDPAEELSRTAKSGEGMAFTLKRRTLFLGKPMRWGGWGRDRQLRFFKKGEAWFDEGKQVHEGAVARGPVEDLGVLLEHDSYPTLRSYFEKMDSYTRLAAQDLKARRLALPFFRLVFLPPWIFLRMAILRLGVLDGWRGLLLAGLSAANEALKDWRAFRLGWNRDRNRNRPQRSSL